MFFSYLPVFALKFILYVSRAAMQLQMPEAALKNILPRTKARLSPGQRSKDVFLLMLYHNPHLSGLKQVR